MKGGGCLDAEGLREEIKAIQEFIEIIELPVVNTEDKVLRFYIQTESINKTKKLLGDIVMPNGNRYQVNDIRDLILNGANGADERVNDLAYRIYKANKKNGGRR